VQELDREKRIAEGVRVAATGAFDYESVPPGFYDTIYRQGSGVRYCWHDFKFRAVARRLKGTRRLLDIGCGPGTFIGHYMSDADCLGIDVAAPQIDYAQRHYATPRHRFSVQTLAGLHAAGERFDAITLIEVIEHLPAGQARALLTQARSLLMADGMLVLTTPNYASLWPVIEWGVNLLSAVNYESQHVNKYRRAGLRADLEGAGFRNVSIGMAVGLAPFVAAIGLSPARCVAAFERRMGHFGMGNLLVAVARP
jgi:2-polyprenyl-3-methyl-5-hydroxy-6-metoxy-1,4-benzoquinol methylase